MTAGRADRGPHPDRSAQEVREPADQGPRPERSAQDVPAPDGRRPLYARLLGLRHLRLRAWQRALLAEGSLAPAVLLVLADLATAWTLLVLPLAVAALVKLHDVVAGLLASPSGGRPERGARPGTPTAPVPEGSRRRRAEDSGAVLDQEAVLD